MGLLPVFPGFLLDEFYEIPVEKKSPVVNCDEFKEKNGYVAVFINNNGLALTKDQHAAIFLGRETDADHLLYDPSGTYAKGRGYQISDPNHRIEPRGGAIFNKGEFSYHDYYLFHRADGPNVNVFAFNLTKCEQEEIRQRIIENISGSEDYAQCTLLVRKVLHGIGPFKNLGKPITPSGLSPEVRKLTKLPTKHDEKSVLKRMRGVQE